MPSAAASAPAWAPASVPLRVDGCGCWASTQDSMKPVTDRRAIMSVRRRVFMGAAVAITITFLQVATAQVAAAATPTFVQA